MFDSLIRDPALRARHENSPYSQQRRRYLEHCAAAGYSSSTLRDIAREILWLAEKLADRPSLGLTRDQVKMLAQQRCCPAEKTVCPTGRRFAGVTAAWLRFLGCLEIPSVTTPFDHLAQGFRIWMSEERGLSSSTIDRREWYIQRFLGWVANRGHQSLSSLGIRDIDLFLSERGRQGWSRVSLKTFASILRVFLRFAGTRHWCDLSLAESIQSPRIFAQEGLPQGPSSSDVRRLLTGLAGDHPKELRDRAILMLLAIYGWRASEVAKLRLDDIDWEQDLIRIFRSKRTQTQVYPLIATVGEAIIRYLKKGRPQSPSRQVFLTLSPPFRCLSRSAIYQLTRQRLSVLGVPLKHQGPHCLRHACAQRLTAEGFSLKEVGDHLGHRSAAATKIYAKVDLASLREVADFDLGGLL